MEKEALKQENKKYGLIALLIAMLLAGIIISIIVGINTAEGYSDFNAGAFFLIMIAAIISSVSIYLLWKTFSKLSNPIARYIKIIAIITALGGLIVGFCNLLYVAFNNEVLDVFSLITIISASILAVFTCAIGEIIQKLQNIEDNMRKT